MSHIPLTSASLPLTEVTGRIFDVQTFSIHDGPGIRTTVFFKGCPLRCLWCHNPESMESRRDIGFLPMRCLLCGQCVAACEHDGHRILDGTHSYDRRICARCGACVPGCPTGALELAGKEVTAAWVIEEVEKDRIFYERSGGGVTLSGGEPLLQPEFTAAILALAREWNLHTALDTCGHYSWATAEPIFRAADLVLYDLKAVDGALHESFTGAPNNVILENLRRLLTLEGGPTVWLRIPLIPGCNDGNGAMEQMIDFCAGIWGNPCLEAATIMPYHRLAESKYERFGKQYTLRGLMPPSDEYVDHVIRRFNERGVPLRRE